MTVTGSVHNYPAIPECDLGTHLGSLQESGSYSDVTLAVGDKEFKAHKAILGGLSLPIGRIQMSHKSDSVVNNSYETLFYSVGRRYMYT